MLAILLPARGFADDSRYYPRRIWGPLSGGELNTSSFVFNDINRNGRYDLGDRAMQNVAVELGKPNGRTIVERTNSGGFANFKMSVAKRDRPVVDPGHYSLRVAPPPGWSVTTDNAIQESDYAITPGAPADMVALRTTHPVGLAQELSISGQLPPGAVLRASGPDGATTDVETEENGGFTIAAIPGDWSIEVARKANGPTEHRSVTVGRAPVVMSTPAADGEPAPDPLPTARSVGFDDLLQAPQVKEIPSGYGGLDWYNLVAMHQAFSGGPGYINTASSGEFIAYNSSGHPAEVSSATPFDFDGAYFGVGWDDAEGETLVLTAWRGSDVAYEDRIVLSSLGPVYFDADYRGISRLQIRTEHFWQATVDDFAYRTGQ